MDREMAQVGLILEYDKGLRELYDIQHENLITLEQNFHRTKEFLPKHPRFDLTDHMKKEIEETRAYVEGNQWSPLYENKIVSIFDLFKKVITSYPDQIENLFLFYKRGPKLNKNEHFNPSAPTFYHELNNGDYLIGSEGSWFTTLGEPMVLNAINENSVEDPLRKYFIEAQKKSLA